jgi:hypothetical protein
MAPFEGLLWIPKSPEDMGIPGEAKHPRVRPVDQGVGAVLLGIVADDALLQVRSGEDKLSQAVQTRS